MNKYSLKFNNLIEKLKMNEDVEIVNVTELITEDCPYAQNGFLRLTKQNHYHLEDSVLEILKIPDNLSLYFFYHKHSFSGEFNLKVLYESLISLYDYKLYNEGFHLKEQVEQLKHFSIIDDHPFSGDFKLAAFYKDPNTSPPKIPDIYFYTRGNYYKMDVDIFQYMNATLDLAGMENWQYLFCNAALAKRDHDHIFQNLRKGIVGLKELFPEQNFSKYEVLANK